MLTSHKRCWLIVGTAYPVHTLVVSKPTLKKLIYKLEVLKSLQTQYLKLTPDDGAIFGKGHVLALFLDNVDGDDFDEELLLVRIFTEELDGFPDDNVLSHLGLGMLATNEDDMVGRKLEGGTRSIICHCHKLDVVVFLLNKSAVGVSIDP